MKVAVVGSRNLSVDDLSKYLPKNTTEVVSGGSFGVDTCARKYAESRNIKLTEFLPEYHKYGIGAPLMRNLKIIEYADCVVAFWDGVSYNTKHVIDICKEQHKKVTVHVIQTVTD